MNKQETSPEAVISDKEVIDRILKGEKELYAIIVRRYNQRLYRVGMSILNNDAEVEDAMQVAYINAFQSLEKFAFKSAFPTWITRILINECLLQLKKKGRSVSLNDDHIENLFHYQHSVESQTPMTRILNSELNTLLEEAIGRLPEKYRTVFIMREIENMNTAETQACLDISEENVKVRLNRAKAMLRSDLNGLFKKEEILHFHLSRCDRMIDGVMRIIYAHY
ncbi:MAG: RNA polymerase sigma factor [Chitinophagaceae bacterium]